MEKPLWVKLLIAKSSSLSELTLLRCTGPLPCPQPQTLCVHNLLQIVHASPFIFPLLPFKHPTQFVNNCSQSFSYLKYIYLRNASMAGLQLFMQFIMFMQQNVIHKISSVLNRYQMNFSNHPLLKPSLRLTWSDSPVISSHMPKSVRTSLWALTPGRLCMLSNWFLPCLLQPTAKSWVRQKSIWDQWKGSRTCQVI